MVIATTPGNWRDDRPVVEMLEQVPALPSPGGSQRQHLGTLQGDRAYGTSRILLTLMTRLGVLPLIAPHGRKTSHGSGLGKTRYVVERTFSWFGHYRRLRSCYEKSGRHFQAFHELAAAIICLRRIQRVLRPVLK